MTKLRHCLIYPAKRDVTVRIGYLAGLSLGEICVYGTVRWRRARTASITTGFQFGQFLFVELKAADTEPPYGGAAGRNAILILACMHSAS